MISFLNYFTAFRFLYFHELQYHSELYPDVALLQLKSTVQQIPVLQESMPQQQSLQSGKPEYYCNQQKYSYNFHHNLSRFQHIQFVFILVFICYLFIFRFFLRIAALLIQKDESYNPSARLLCGQFRLYRR